MFSLRLLYRQNAQVRSCRFLVHHSTTLPEFPTCGADCGNGMIRLRTTDEGCHAVHDVCSRNYDVVGKDASRLPGSGPRLKQPRFQNSQSGACRKQLHPKQKILLLLPCGGTQEKPAKTSNTQVWRSLYVLIKTYTPVKPPVTSRYCRPSGPLSPGTTIPSKLETMEFIVNRRGW